VSKNAKGQQPEASNAEVVDARLTRFSPKDVAPEVWAVVGPVARDAVARAEPRSAAEATELMSRATALAVFCHGAGMDLRPEVVFAPQTVDHFISVGCAHLAAGTQINYRRILRRVGAAVLGPPAYPERALATGSG
jgi:hypothetical protein